MSRREARPTNRRLPVAVLKDASRDCLRNLAAYHTPTPRLRAPRARRAAVLIALFLGRQGDIYVLLTRRADKLNSYAGDTALPGGKAEKGDRNPEDTARREAFEEIGLPKDKRRVPLLCTLEPFLSGNNLIVTPVVVLVTDVAIRPILNAPEVASLFSHPLIAFLSFHAPFPLASHNEAYHTHQDIAWSAGGGPVRMHRFLTGREGEGIKPVFGLTSAILIRTAEIGYARTPEFEVRAPEQKSMRWRIAHALRSVPSLRDAAREEGIRWHLLEEGDEEEAMLERNGRGSWMSKL